MPAQLPNACPIVSESFLPGAMNRCRFSEQFLREFVADQVLTLDSGCPFIHLCGLMCLITAKGTQHAD